MSAEANTNMAKTLIQQEMSKHGLKIENTENGLRLATAEGTDYYLDNQKVSVKDFIDKSLATHKVLVIDEAKQQNPTNPTHLAKPDKPSSAFNKIDAELQSVLKQPEN